MDIFRKDPQEVLRHSQHAKPYEFPPITTTVSDAQANLHVLEVHGERATEIVMGHDGLAPDDTRSDQGVTQLTYYRVPSGGLAALPYLRDAGIAYDAVLGECAHGPAALYGLRFRKNGTCEDRYLPKSAWTMPIEPLIARARAGDQKGLLQLIENHYALLRQMPWIHQEQYGKLYRMVQAVMPQDKDNDDNPF